MPPDRSFYFRGPKAKCNLRAQNLLIFMQIAEGLDKETWMHHLRQGDYSRWFRERIKDEKMAKEAAGIEWDKNIDFKESRKRICELIEKYYTLPASNVLPMPGTDAESK